MGIQKNKRIGRPSPASIKIPPEKGLYEIKFTEPFGESNGGTFSHFVQSINYNNSYNHSNVGMVLKNQAPAEFFFKNYVIERKSSAWTGCSFTPKLSFRWGYRNAFDTSVWDLAAKEKDMTSGCGDEVEKTVMSGYVGGYKKFDYVSLIRAKIGTRSDCTSTNVCHNKVSATAYIIVNLSDVLETRHTDKIKVFRKF